LDWAVFYVPSNTV